MVLRTTHFPIDVQKIKLQKKMEQSAGEVNLQLNETRFADNIYKFI